MRKILCSVIIACLLFSTSCLSQALYDFTIFKSTNTPVFTGTNFKAVGVGRGGFIWAGTQYQGLYRYNPTLKTWEKYNDGLTNVFISDIKTDRKGGIWISQAGTSGLQGGGSNIAGGVNYFKDSAFSSMSFYSITSGGGLTSRNARSLWIDQNRNNQDSLPKVWVAQGTYITSSATTAGGISVGLNNAANYFSKITNGLQVTPNVTPFNAGTPSCISVAGDATEAWVFALTNFGKSQVLRYRTDDAGSTFVGAYDNTTTPLLAVGLRANAMYFDANNRKWLGLANNGLIIKENSSWKFMNDTAIFPIGTTVNPNAITKDEDGNILIGTTNGLVVYYTGPVDSAASYRRLTTVNGLPSNNINHIAIDTVNSRILLATDSGVVFMKQRKNIDVKLVWDRSFPDPGIKPKGVTADGVARLYIRVKKANDTLPAVSRVQLQMDNFSAALGSLRGRLKKADTLDRYTTEANTGTLTDVNRTDSISDGSFWFWYVAPEDFCQNPTDREATLSERDDSVKVIITYANDRKDSMIQVIKVTRPPVIVTTLEHKINGRTGESGIGARGRNTTEGNGGGNQTTSITIGLLGGQGSSMLLNALGFDMPLLESINNELSSSLSPNLDKLSQMFLAPPPLVPSPFSEPLPGIRPQAVSSDVYARKNLIGLIYEMRLKGYACSQADYIGHGPSVNAVRAAASLRPKKFFSNDATLPFNNFGKGYIHKTISVNAPHCNAPVFDMLTLIQRTNSEFLKRVLGNDVLKKPAQQEPYQFFQNGNTDGDEGGRSGTGSRPLNTPIGSNPYLNNLFQQLAFPQDALVDAAGQIPSFALPGLMTQFHAIAGNVAVSPANWNLIPFKPSFGRTLELMLMTMRDRSPGDKAFFTQLFDSTKPLKARYLEFLNRAHNSYGFANFSQNGDFLIPMNSMLAGLPAGSPYVSVFNNTWPDSLDAMHIPIFYRDDVRDKLFDLLNAGVNSPFFLDSIPGNYNNLYRRPQIVEKPVGVRYDTSRIVIDGRGTISTTTYTDTLIQVKYRIKDTTNLQYVYIAFQDTSYTTLKKTRNQQINMRIKNLMEYSGTQEVSALAVYERTDSILYYVDTLSAYVLPPDSIQDFRVTDQEFDLINGAIFYPAYEVKVKGAWQTMRSDNDDLAIVVSGTNAIYDSATLSFDATGDGFARAFFQYKQFRDTVDFNCALSWDKRAVNKTISSGSFKNPTIWSKGWVPQPDDSVIIVAGHSVILDTTVQVRSLKIENTAILTLNDNTKNLQLGTAEDGAFVVDNYGSLVISNGRLTVNGRVKLNSQSVFNMTGGSLVIDGNTGNTVTSLQNGLFLFQAAPQMLSFAFTGGMLQIIDPPLGVASQAVSCPYNFGINSTLILGNGISLTASENPNGFGGAGFPPQIGRLILDAGTANSNRQLTITQPLNVKGAFEIRTGSNLIIKAQTSVTQ